MSPLETIKLGIQEDDINIVRQGYFQLTGEAVDTQEEEVAVSRTTKKATKKKATKKKTTKRKATKKKATRKKATKKKATKRRVTSKEGFVVKDPTGPREAGDAKWTGNLFESEMGHTEEMTDDEANQLGELIGAGGQRERIAQDAYQPIDMDCHRCKKTVSVNPAYIVPSAKYYYCDGCLDKRR